MESISSVELLTWAMDKALASHSVSRMNVAGANIEGFKPVKISFADQIAALEKADSNGEIEKTLGEIKQTLNEMLADNTYELEDGSVQLDMEVAEMVRQSGSYKVLADVMSRKLGMMKLAITGRG